MRESTYQTALIKRIKERFPDSLVLKNDSSYMQGIPDLLVLHGRHWALLEVKAHEGAAEQPNQRHYVELADKLSFSAFIYPENEEEVLDALQRSFHARRSSRISQRQ